MRCRLNTLILAGLLCWSPWAWADIYVVINATNDLPVITQKQALDLFMGRHRHFPNGVKVQTFDLARGSQERERFYRSLTGMDMAQVNSYWSRLMFSGQTLPPQQLPDEGAMLDALRDAVGGIGYLSKPPEDKALSVVLVLKASQ